MEFPVLTHGQSTLIITPDLKGLQLARIFVDDDLDQFSCRRLPFGFSLLFFDLVFGRSFDLLVRFLRSADKEPG